MRVALVHLVSILPLALATVPAHAQSEGALATVAIQRGDYATAERRLIARLEVQPGLPEAMLNLATVYRHTDRPEAARRLYQAVLEQEDVLLNLPNDRVAGSHALARAGLLLLEPSRVSAR